MNNKDRVHHTDRVTLHRIIYLRLRFDNITEYPFTKLNADIAYVCRQITAYGVNF